MTRRYFKATDGAITVFRASATRVYAFASFNAPGGVMGGRWADWPSFSAKVGKYPAVEITKAEYDALQAAKVARIVAAGGDPKRATAPFQSWARNS